MNNLHKVKRKMDKMDLKKLIKTINFDNNFIEATFQFRLLMALGKIYREDDIFPERSIKAYFTKEEIDKFKKREIDIVLRNQEKLDIAIELKMPMNGQFPEQMYQFVKDIKFLEELKSSKKFSQCFLIVVTDNKLFWQGDKKDGIYSSFRNKIPLSGTRSKPTGPNKDHIEFDIELEGKYDISWNDLNNDFKYFIVEIKNEPVIK